MNTLRNDHGQFIPISAMVMLTMVVLMVATVNIYKVSRAKLKVQNIADAAALNLAAQQAQAFNVVADRNEWMNNMMAGVPSPSDSNAPGIADCRAFSGNNPGLIPGISCVENTHPRNGRNARNRYVFHRKESAANYAAIVQTMNEAQALFVDAYNSFLGDRSRAARSPSATASPTHFSGLLMSDIPELKTDDSISLVAWNSMGNEPSLDDASQMPGGVRSNMQGLRFKPHHDMQVAYFKRRCLWGICRDNAIVEKTTLGDLMFGEGQGGGQPVGYMVPDWNSTPKISVNTANGPSNQVGVGVMVKKDVQLPVIGNVPVSAKAKAYVVSNSGESGENGGVPKFKPTFWSKLAN